MSKYGKLFSKYLGLIFQLLKFEKKTMLKNRMKWAVLKFVTRKGQIVYFRSFWLKWPSNLHFQAILNFEDRPLISRLFGPKLTVLVL